jgi:hypothetical protein
LLSRGLSLLRPGIFDDPCSSTKSKIDFSAGFSTSILLEYHDCYDPFCLFWFSPVSLHSSQYLWFIDLMYHDAIIVTIHFFLFRFSRYFTSGPAVSALCNHRAKCTPSVSVSSPSPHFSVQPFGPALYSHCSSHASSVAVGASISFRARDKSLLYLPFEPDPRITEFFTR